MTATRTTDAQAETEALINATTAAAQAPSIHHTRPWRWRIDDDRIDLFIQDSRIVNVTDPAHRLAILSCGTALHHARVSLAADGRHVAVTRLPDAAEPRHLATVRVDADIPVEPDAIRHFQTIALRHTDRRPVLSTPVDADKLRSIAAAAQSQGALLHLLRPLQALELVSAADHAQRALADQTARQAKSQQWDGGIRPPGILGSRSAARTTVPSQGFGHPENMNIADTHDRAAVFAVLYGPTDDELDWLRAGEALSAAWLNATELGISVLPLSATIEVAATREIVRHLLADLGYPYLVLRFGVTQADTAVSPHTLRLPTNHTAERW